MKLKKKFVSIERIIEYGKSKKSKSDSYILVSTAEMLEHIQLSLDTFCQKLRAGIQIECLIEKVDEQFPFGIFVMEIPKKMISENELKQITPIGNKLPFVFIEDSVDFKNKNDLEWYLEKIEGKTIPKKDLKILEYTDSVHQDNETGISIHKVMFEPLKCRPLSATLTSKAEELLFELNANKAYGFAKIAILLDPENFLAEQVLGTIAKYVHDIPLAIKHFENVKKINPNFYSGRKMLAVAYFLSNEYEKSLAELENMDVDSRQDIEKFDWNINCSKAKMMLGFHDDAIQHLKTAESFSPPGKIMNGPLWALYLWWGQACFMVGDYEGMLYPLKQIILKEPTDITTWNNLGFCNAQVGKKDEALNCYEKAYDLNENEINSLMNLGSVYEERREYVKALEFLKKAKLNLNQLPEAKSILDKHIEYNQKMVEKGAGVTKEISTDSLQQLIEKTVNKNLKEKLSSQAPEIIPSKKLKNILFNTRESLQNFIRKKYNLELDIFRKEFPENFAKAQKIMNSAKDSSIKRKQSNDIFDYVDFGDFPYIIKKWIKDRDIINNLHAIKNSRNVIAHFDGPDKGELDSLDANLCYYRCLQVIRYFDNLERT